MKAIILGLTFISVVNSFQINSRYVSLGEIISKNIDEFNCAEIDGKRETYFNKVSKILNVYDENLNKYAETIVFDDNKGYLTYSKDNEIIKESYDEGLPFEISKGMSGVIFSNNNYYSLSNELLFSSDNNEYGKANNGYDFYFHSDIDFNNKTRTMLTEWDSSYYTLTESTSCTYGNKITWSTYQGQTSHCCQLAIANLLWTYKVNGVVDLTNNASSSSDLESTFTQYLLYNDNLGTWQFSLTGVTRYFETYYPDSGYYIDYINVNNGISDNLAIAPIIGYYNGSGNNGHFALVTGKGKSLYKKILGIEMWTSWDIVNTWYDYGTVTYRNGNPCPSYKYWVDNKYIHQGYVLRQSNGNTVPLNIAED